MEAILTQVSPDLLKQALEVSVACRRPSFTWGHPGVGKSQIHRQVADELGLELVDVRASQWDAVDTRGVPYVEDRRTRWAIPDVFPQPGSAPSLLLLDELNSAPPSVQAALYQLVLDRRLGDYVLPDSAAVAAAGNLETDRAVTHRMSTALANRFTHYELVVDPKAWEIWALRADVHVAVVTFMRYRPGLLHDWKPRADAKAQPTPRTWEFASEQLKECERRGVGQDVEAAVLAGTVGEGAGAELVGFLRVYRDLPDPRSILAQPETAEVPDEPEVCWALCGALASQATVKNCGAILTYARRLGQARTAGPEFMTLLVRTMTIRVPAIQSTRDFIRWASDNPEVLL